MKKTAVEWLIDMLITENEVTLKGENFKLFEMAKAMEKEENEYFFNCGRQYQLTGEGTFTEINSETYEK